ncbi:asr3708 [Nostoc sp. PCC 7120 = FACHB-418]|nr:asr3708 [Nostoc sp. PCC 7120 = FACHB-418]
MTHCLVKNYTAPYSLSPCFFWSAIAHYSFNPSPLICTVCYLYLKQMNVEFIKLAFDGVNNQF